jgi:hypothetical protein
VARTWNDNLTNSGMQPIDDGEVVTTAVWDDYQTGKLVRTHVRRAIAITDADEVRELLAEYENGAEAVALLMLLSPLLLSRPQHLHWRIIWARKRQLGCAS